MKRIVTLLLVFLSVPLFLCAEVTFSGPDLSEDNRLLFNATADSPVYGEYDSLFLSNVEDRTIDQLTVFPESLHYLKEPGLLQFRNRFGVFRTDEELKNLKPIEGFNAFSNGDSVQTGKIQPLQESPDGRFLLYLAPTSSAFADLVMIDLRDDRNYVVSRKLERRLDGPAAKWSENSKFFIYEKGGTLYYYSIEQFREDRVPAEQFRSIGDGKLPNIAWGRQNELYYLAGPLIYQIRSAEFFTRTLYSELLNIGTIVGKVPFDFDPNFDSFWMSPDYRYILFNKGGRNIFLYYLGTDDYRSDGDTKTLPYLFLPRNTRVKKVLWSDDGYITLFTGSIVEGEKKSALFRLKLEGSDSQDSFVRTNDTGIQDIALSPDGNYAALLKEDRVIIRRYRSWRDLVSFYHPGPLHAIWKDGDEIIISGEVYTEMRNIITDAARTIAFSQPEAYGFAEEDGCVQMEAGRGRYTYLPDENRWTSISSMDVKEPSQASESYRIYLEQLHTYSYRNIIMVRNITGYGTKPLFDYPPKRYEPFPSEEEPVDFVNFSHGSRVRRREVSLVFNAVDSVEGLTEILNILDEYDLRATFFVNGEFIRRNPGAVNEIADSGHEVGSLFYAYFNMTDANFRVTKDFIKGGLARNEDAYYSATGNELSLLWHAPYYFINTEIIEVSQEMNYSYVGRDVDPLDWVPRTGKGGASAVYLSAAEIIERVVNQKKPGSIIPVRVGKPFGGREDYLFQKLDLLLNNLIADGYSVVPVSTLMEHAK
ncbi:MAG: polysaccharide deacetylase family protein [Spirochaetales bacterium]|nr:polysaccharide deacetylase family protein [Spirochaetales bacterium]MCF7938587.1 polysaccharide deacetylase family protein [Spirochaetales bacterium]